MKTIEEKAKAYDEAIKRVENIRTGKCETTFMFTEGLFEHIFPELAESEDEKVRRELLLDIPKVFPHDKAFRYIAYLEKQGEQKHDEWHREDEQNLNACLGYIPDEFLRRWLTDAIHTRYDKHAEWKPSEEQLHTLEKAMHIVGSKYKPYLASLYQELNELKE